MQRCFMSPVLSHEKKLQPLLDEGWRVDPNSVRVTPGVPVQDAGAAPDAKKRTVHLYTAILTKE